MMELKHREQRPGIATYGCATLVYGTVLIAFAAVEYVLMRGLWRPFDIATYYGLAGSAVGTISAVVDAGPRQPALVLDTGLTPGLAMAAVAVLALATALLALETGVRLFGKAPGFLAGLLFTLNIAWVLGYLTVGDALALVMALASAFALLCLDRKYLAAGLCAGAAACLMPLSLLALPGTLYYLYKKGELKGAPGFLAGLLLPLMIFGMAAIAAYGENTPAIALDGGFTLVGLHVAGEGSPDALMAVANIVLAACAFTSLLPLAVLGFSGRKRGAHEEYLLAAGLLLMASVFLKQYLHYWLLALPLLALSCANISKAGGR